MAVTFTINITRTFVATNPHSSLHDSVYHAFTTSRRVENDQRTMKQLFDEVVLQYITPGLKGINYYNPMLFDAANGFSQPLTPRAMNSSIQHFIKSETPTTLDISESYFTFMVNVAAKPIAVYPLYPTANRIAE